MISMFHCTKRESLDRILQEGLKPHQPRNILNPTRGVYLSISPFEWMHYVTEGSKCAGAMIEVDVSGLALIMNFNNSRSDGKKIPEFISKEPISVGRFIRVTASTIKKPCCFDEVRFKNERKNTRLETPKGDKSQISNR
jgi:hypothetical protein